MDFNVTKQLVTGNWDKLLFDNAENSNNFI